MSAPKDWFRSADMEYISLVIQEHCAHRVACELGRLGTMQFTDLNPSLTPFQRRYVKEIQRCDDMERKLRYIEDMLDKFSIKARPPPADATTFLDELDKKVGGQNPIVVIDQLEVTIQSQERELLNLAGFGATLASEQSSKIELKNILDKIRVFAGQEDPNVPRAAQNVTTATAGGNNAEAPDKSMKFRFITGVIPRDDRADFERVVFRTTRGNCFSRFAAIDEPVAEGTTNKMVYKDVFIIFYQANYIEEKLKKVCDSFSARTYPVPNIENSNEINAMTATTTNDINEGKSVIQKNRVDTIKLLRELSQYVEEWKWTIRREKAVYHSLNLFKVDVNGVLRAEGWVVAKEKDVAFETVEKVHSVMAGESSASLPYWTSTLSKSEWPTKAPTYFRTNRFTVVFQLIIDTYGIPRYQEANPALFAAVCFPFMFGIMFGDIGHGLLLFLFSLLVVLREKSLGKQNLGELGSLIYNGRYLLLLNGMFAFYAGLLYNDCFGMGLLLFKSIWVPLPPDTDHETNQTVIHFQRTPPDAVYPLGVDPTWHISENALLFFNSFKMKMAVIIGVVEMSGGIILRGLNAIHYSDGKSFNLDLWFEAIPMFIFMQALFGYMCFMIFYKWSISWAPDCGRSFECGEPNCSCFNPPSIITTLINMVLSPGTVNLPLYANQGTVQAALVLIALIMIPIMLIPKPVILINRLKHSHAHQEHDQHGITEGHSASPHQGTSMGAEQQALVTADGNNGIDAENGHDVIEGAAPKEEEHGVGDIVIHQAIETIEFVLGCISNTASYLRLWALSLAHSQLSQVFLQRTVFTGVETAGAAEGPLFTWATTAVFFAITFAVILCMDNLECFLHALRLVWVEFMSKFYKGEGLKFNPLNFNLVLHGVASD